jgi:hypothetical protein
MNPWVHGIFSGIILSLLGVGAGALGTWLALRLIGWQRWVATSLAIAGFIIVFWGLAVVMKRFYDPFKM